MRKQYALKTHIRNRNGRIQFNAYSRSFDLVEAVIHVQKCISESHVIEAKVRCNSMHCNMA